MTLVHIHPIPGLLGDLRIGKIQTKNFEVLIFVVT